MSERASERSSGQPTFVWKDFSRFVEVVPVQTGWLVLWGRYVDQGRRRILAGNRVYADLAGVRRRVANQALGLTKQPRLAEEALGLFDRAELSER